MKFALLFFNKTIKNQNTDDKAKSFRWKAHKTEGMKRALCVRCND